MRQAAPRVHAALTACAREHVCDKAETNGVLGAAAVAVLTDFRPQAFAERPETLL
jgi:hypothetical protein